MIHMVISMYTMAAEHYDNKHEASAAEIYRMKIQMLFTKPHVIMKYAL